MLDGTGRDRRQKRLLVMNSSKRGFQILDLSLQGSVADVLDRTVAENPFSVFAAHRSQPFAKIVAEIRHVARENRRGPLFRPGFTLDEAAQALARVAGKVGFTNFAVVDDVESAIDLLADYISERAPNPRSEDIRIASLPTLSRRVHPFQVVRLGQTARMRR